MRDEFQAEIRSRVDDLENECYMLKQRQLESEAKISDLEEKVDILQSAFEISEKKANYLGVVLENQQWEYPYSIPTIQEIRSCGYNEQDSEDVHIDITDMAVVTERMRKGELIYHITPNRFNVIQPFYEEYLYHYEAFAEALIEYRHTIYYNDTDTNELLHCFMLDPTSLPREILETALKYTHFDKLKFYQNNLQGVGYIEFIANCISSNIRLKYLELNDITFQHTREIDELCVAINTKYTLHSLELADCVCVGDLHQVFNKLKSKTVKNISLSGRNLSNLRRTDMSVFLLSNPSLRFLKLWSIPFTEEDIVYIADALRSNTTLHKLTVGFNSYPIPSNWHYIGSAIFNCTSLNAVYNSNHHCSIRMTQPQSSILDKFNKCNDPVKNRRKKIYNILSTRNRRRENAAYFESDGIRIKHIPQILASLKSLSEHYLGDKRGSQHVDEVKPLSIAFEIMRDWKIPELYNYLDLMEED
eukprot:scaffold15382_cov104-Cyclotella_meneghiniana.AAC.2